MIRYVKEHLSIAERAHGDGRWVVHLDAIVAHYNNEFVKNTRFRRKDINQHNYVRFLIQLRNTPDVSMLFNMSQSFHSGTALSRFLWKFKVGDLVLLARDVDYNIRGKTFTKASVEGTYGDRVYTVTATTTKLNSDLFITPVYRLSGMTGLFYQTELSPALFADQESPAPVRGRGSRGRRGRGRPTRRRS
jgi:hypothetical protein